MPSTEPRFITELPRTHTCGALRGTDAGAEVVLMGWVDATRDHGGTFFVDLRDRFGRTQLRFDSEVSVDALTVARALRGEDNVGVVGKVVHRGDNVNDRIPTGEIEVWVDRVEVFSKAATPPFVVAEETDATEPLRLKYRYLDLRRPCYQRALELRSRITRVVRDALHAQGFLEIETPYLGKSTPEGARDYLVPSRVHDGGFYALPQSPQLFKQLLMVAGYERYYQIARCFRDEDLRADRQPEFTQIDLELSYAGKEDVFAVVEAFMAAAVEEVTGSAPETPFARMTHEEAMRRFGLDKPDVRFGLELCDVSDLVADVPFKVFSQTVADGGSVALLAVPGGATALSRKEIDKLVDVVRPYGAKGLAWAKVGPEGWTGAVAKFVPAEVQQAIATRAGAEAGALVLFVADGTRVVREALGQLRNHLGARLGLVPEGDNAFLWVTDFPLFEPDDEAGGWTSSHHPFTSPSTDAIDTFVDEPGSAASEAYDLVLNGVELGSGSVRIHDPDVQRRIFSVLGIEETEAQARFGFFLEALTYGTPPHAGIALGMDRIVMLLGGYTSMRDVIAFPKTTKAADLMSEAPSEVGDEQLGALGLKLR